MAQSFDTVTIIGVGLLGASLGLGLKSRELAKTVRGVGRRMESLAKAQERGAIDEAHLDAKQAVRGAELVVICTPAALVSRYLDDLVDCLGDGTVLTDVASTKESICRHAMELWPESRRFAGSHPMAGSEKYGPDHADGDLYEGAVTFVERRADGIAPDAHEAVLDLWRSLGSTPVEMEPGIHDQIIASTSQVPHIVSAALAKLACADGDVGPYVGNGFRDTTRIAEGRPEIWRDIALTNGPAIQRALDSIIEELRDVSKAVATGNGQELEDFFEAGVRARRRVLNL